MYNRKINKTCGCGKHFSKVPAGARIASPEEFEGLAGIYFECNCRSTLFIPQADIQRRSVLIPIGVAVISVFLFTACGGDGGGVSADTRAPAHLAPVPTPSASASPMASPSPSPSPSASPTASPSPSPSPSASASPYAFPGGLGTQGNPYQLETAQDVQNIDQFPAAYFTVMQDINMASIANFRPLAAFSGTVYGNNHSLYNLVISTSGSAQAGLFISLSGTLVNLELQNVTISSQFGYATGFAGTVTGTGLISSCGISGTITSPLGGNGFNTGTGNSVYTSLQSGGSVVNTTQAVQFNGNTVNATI